jgi:hypothetical protein
MFWRNTLPSSSGSKSKPSKKPAKANGKLNNILPTTSFPSWQLPACCQPGEQGVEPYAGTGISYTVWFYYLLQHARISLTWHDQPGPSQNQVTFQTSIGVRGRAHPVHADVVDLNMKHTKFDHQQIILAALECIWCWNCRNSGIMHWSLHLGRKGRK